MKTAVVTFTCARDARRAAFHAAHLPAEWLKIWCVTAADAAACGEAAPAGTEIRTAEFDRGASLKGDAAVAGMARVFLRVLEALKPDVLVKLDSDTELFEPRAFTAPWEAARADFTYVRRFAAESRLLANGCCYAMSARAVARLEKFSPAAHALPNFEGHEDLIFSHFFTTVNKDLTLCQVNKRLWSWCEVPRIAADTLGAHNGYLSEEEDFARCGQIRALREAAR